MIRIGRQVGGLAAIGLGGLMVGWGDFALPWHQVPLDGPARIALVWAVAAALILAGAGLVFRRTARPAALVLAAIFAVFALLRIPPILKSPEVYDTWGNLAEQSSVMAGYLAAFACLLPRDSDSDHAARLALAARVWFGVCSLSFGAVHFIYLKMCVGFIPTEMPLGGVFWSVLTGVGHLAAGVAILSGVFALLAARLATAMYVCFGLLWAYHLFWASQLKPQLDHFMWTGNVINFTLVAAVWMIADSIAAFPPKDGKLFRLRAQAA